MFQLPLIRCSQTANKDSPRLPHFHLKVKQTQLAQPLLYFICSSPLNILLIFCWTCSGWSIFSLHSRAQIWPQHSRICATSAELRGRITSFCPHPAALLRQPGMPIALFAVRAHVHLVGYRIPRSLSFSAKLCSAQESPSL